MGKELGETLSEGILQHWCSSSEVTKFKITFGLEGIESVEKEYFYLIMFLASYSCQIAFLKNKKLAKIILDNFHKYIMEKRFNLPLELLEAGEAESQLSNRYAQYYELSRTKEHNIDLDFLISQVPYNFFANLFKKDLKYVFNDKDFRNRWGMSTIKLSSWIGDVLTEFTNLMSKIKEKYIVKDRRGKSHLNLKYQLLAGNICDKEK